MGRESIEGVSQTTANVSVVSPRGVLTVPAESEKSDAVEQPIPAQRFPASAANGMQALAPVGRRGPQRSPLLKEFVFCPRIFGPDTNSGESKQRNEVDGVAQWPS